MKLLNSKQASALIILVLILVGAVVYRAREKTNNAPFLSEESAKQQNITHFSLSGKLTEVGADHVKIKAGQVVEVTKGDFQFVEEEKTVKLTDATEINAFQAGSSEKKPTLRTSLTVGREAVIFVSSYPYGNNSLTADMVDLVVQ